MDVAVTVARTMETRSEDPWTKVGAVALTSDNRIIATAYNGLLPNMDIHVLFGHLEPHGFLCDNAGFPVENHLRAERLPYMIHAEQNLCSLIKRGEATWCVTTVCPCPSCLLLLACHGIKKIVYLDDYARDNSAVNIAKFYNIDLCQYAKTKI